MVRELEFNIDPSAPQQSCRCSEDEQCQFCEVSKLCINIVDHLDMRLWLTRRTHSTDPNRALRYLHYEEWSRDLDSSEFWPAAFGTALHLVPNLELFSVNAFCESLWGKKYWFGDAMLFPSRLIVGFSSLTILKTTFVPPWPILKTPSLRTLHVDLAYEGMLHQHLTSDDRYDIPDSDSCVHIETLVLVLSVCALEPLAGAWPASHEWVAYSDLRYMQRRLGNLKNLQIRLSYDTELCFVETNIWRICYGDFMPYFEATTLESIIIDTTDVDWLQYKADGISHWGFELHSSRPGAAEPMSVSVFYDEDWNLPSLRRFVAPQEAFFCAHPHRQSPWRPARLPLTVEIVEVIDSTRALNNWAKYVLDHPLEFPSLTRIVLWCDRLAVPLAPDKRIRYDETMHGATDDGLQHDTLTPLHQDDDYINEYDSGIDGVIGLVPDYSILYEVGDEVWEQLRLASIELVIHFKQEQGWRDV
ncbi:hypothetical protein BKA66DRAFT_574896 [Pyrenochaeta sp. MPI-SDFR-AT-0127]|nr:hypothetical protein BKA66DRAFT_574896 [Pyrenochaeta sp. MPI-SDFR-AT-0127]